MAFSRRSGGRGLALYLGLAGAIAGVVFWKFLTFRAAYLFKDIAADSVNVLYPQLRHLFDYWRTDGLPGWSFNQGLGQNIYPFSWNDPFFLLLIPFSGASLPFGFAYMEVFKIILAGAIFFFYLREMALTEKASAAGALLYAFSGFVVIGGPWAVFSTEAVYCAFLLFAFERYLARGDWRWLPVPVALLAYMLPYLLFPYAIFFFLYGTIRFFDERGSSAKGYWRFILVFALCVSLAKLMAGAMVFSDVLQLLRSPRGAGTASFFSSLSAKPVLGLTNGFLGVTAYLRLYSNDLLGLGSDFKGWGNYLEAPTFYCGLISLLLVPQAFAYLDIRRSRLYAVLAAVALLPLFFPFFRYALWAFSGDYFRSYSLFIVVLLLFFSARALSRLEETHRVQSAVLAGSLTLSVLLLFAVPAAAKAPVDAALSYSIAVALIVEAALIHLLGKKKHARLAMVGLLAAISVEAGAAAYRAVDTRPTLTAEDVASKSGYNDSTIDAIAALRAADPSFYRIEKDYRSNPTPYRGFNDAKAQGYYGSSSYNQFNEPSSVEFMAELEVLDPAKETDTRWMRGLRDREKLMSLVGSKYFLTKTPTSESAARFKKDFVGNYGDVTVFRNRHALPLGFTYDRCLTYADFNSLNSAGKDEALLDAFVSDKGGDCLGFPAEAAVKAAASVEDRAVLARSEDVLALDSHSQNALAGMIKLERRKLLFFSIPFDEGWSARVDEKPATLVRVDVGFMGLPLEPGTHRVELRFTPPLRAEGAMLSLAGLGIYGFLLTRRKRKS
jgi:uncharacterized membrane protein YfhO